MVQVGEGSDELFGGLKAVRRLFRQQSPTQFVVTFVELAPNRRRGGRMHVRDLLQQFECPPSLERTAAREALEQDAAEGKEIAAAVERPLMDLLGRHVGGRAEQRMRLGETRGGVVGGDVFERRKELGDPEVKQLGVSSRRQNHILRLQVAMNDAAPVCGGQGVCNLRARGERVTDRQRPARETCGERLPLDVLHDHVGAPGGIGADIVDRADGWVIEGRDSTRFLYEAARERIARLAGCDELDRHVPLERFVVGEVDIAHSPRADEPAEAIPPESDVSGLYVHFAVGGAII